MTRPTPYLHGNCAACPACGLRRQQQNLASVIRTNIPCNQCNGLGYIELTPAQIIDRMKADAAKWHWPEFDRLCAYPRTPSSSGTIREIGTPCGEAGENTGCGGQR